MAFMSELRKRKSCTWVPRDGLGDELLQATKGLQREVLGPWRQSVLEHGRHLSYRTTVVYVCYRPIADGRRSAIGRVYSLVWNCIIS